MVKTTFPIILGLSLSFCGVAGAFYYYYLAKAKEDEEVYKTGKLEKDGKRYTFLVENHQVPLIIGRNSKVIEKIETDTSTKIRFVKKDELTHLCIIEGDLAENVMRASDAVNVKRHGPHLETDEVFVNIENDKVTLSGRAQEDIAKRTQAKIWIDTKHTKGGGTLRRVLVTGTREQIEEAKKLIEEKSKEMSPSPDSTTSNVVVPKGSTEKLDSIDQIRQIDVYVSCIESPSKFYVQIFGSQTNELDILGQEMTDYYENEDNRKFHDIREPSLGQIVAAKFNLDERWYRAKIVAVQPNEYKKDEITYDLLFLDYGDRQYVDKKSEIFELRPDFLSLRFQAIECYLAEVLPVKPTAGGDWDLKAIQRFEELTHVGEWKKMSAKVVRSETSEREGSPAPPGLQLYTYDDKDDRSIAQILVQEGLAKFTESQKVTKIETPPIPDSTIIQTIPEQRGDALIPKNTEETDKLPKIPQIEEIPVKIPETPVKIPDVPIKSFDENVNVSEKPEVSLKMPEIPEITEKVTETPGKPDMSNKFLDNEKVSDNISGVPKKSDFSSHFQDFEKVSDKVPEIPKKSDISSKFLEDEKTFGEPETSDKLSKVPEVPDKLPKVPEVPEKSEEPESLVESEKSSSFPPQIDISTESLDKEEVSETLPEIAENSGKSEKIEVLEPSKEIPEPSKEASETVIDLPKEPVKTSPETNGTSEPPKESVAGGSSSGFRNFPDPPMNGKSNKKSSKNKSKYSNDFLNSERGGGGPPPKSNKKNFRTQDWNDLMNE